MDDVEYFFDEFQDLNIQILRARHQDFAALMRRWFHNLETGPEIVAKETRRLMERFPWERVEADVLENHPGMGPDYLNWPDGVEERLGAQLNLFRKLADNEIEPWQFAHQYFGTANPNINDTLHEMTEHLFDGHVGELERFLRRRLDIGITTTSVPASDRVVPIDHNAQAYTDLSAALSEVELAAEQSNELNPEDRERVKAELSAGRRLLEAPVIRLNLVSAILVSSLTWLSLQFAETAVQPAIQAALNALISLFPSLPI
jgi:hypothetical protein